MTPSFSAIRSASSGLERPAKSISRFCGPRSIHGVRSVSGSAGASTVSSPGSVASAISLSLLSDVAFLRDLALTRDREGLRRDIVRDDRSGPDPRIVADLDGRNKRIVDAGSDVAADLGARLLRAPWCGRFTVMLPAPMFVSSPMSASPMYDRCGTFARSPMREFLISTNAPAFAPASSTVPGRR